MATGETPRIAAPDEARSAVAGLVERFARHVDDYRRGGYNETQVRRDFIDPLFEALGWDVGNRSGYAEAYRDVIHEDAIRVAGGTKAPDYCFRVGGRRMFFLEAKKPSVSVKDDPSPAYQLRRYAWSADLPLSILTDFEELAVYDCRSRPKPTDAPSVARVRYVTFDCYAEQFDSLYATFSREAVLRGSFDRYAEGTRGKRGTSEVDDEFLGEIEKWRDALAKDIARGNPSLGVHELNACVQALVDRILFLRIAEDRGVEPYEQLRNLAGRRSIYAGLWERFGLAEQKYDSGLFDFTREGDALARGLQVSDKVLKPILAGLYYPDCPYEFSVIGADILGAVYERFLGKVIRLTAGHQAKVEEKPEVRKAGGVYYTPRYVVDYIVEHTVGEMLGGGGRSGLKPTVSGGGGRAAADEGSSDSGLQPAAEPTVSGERRDPPILRILDPACGSGSFLLGAYQYLLDWHLRYYTEGGGERWSRGKSPRIAQRGIADWRLTLAERKRILTESIFGVDIDRQAVEVTKLNLLLKCLEGETEQTVGAQFKLFHERVLPNIDANIRCGNSLIGPDYWDGKQTGLFDEEEARRVNPFDWEREFAAIMAPRGERVLWLVTLVTHNSRVSERMVQFGARRGEPLLLGSAEQIEMARQLAEASRRYELPVVALNVLPDHVHLVVAAEGEADLEERVGRVKGASAHAFRGLGGADAPGHVWARKFHRVPVTDDESLARAVEYVRHNHHKHAERWGEAGDGLKGSGGSSGLKPTVYGGTGEGMTSGLKPTVYGERLAGEGSLDSGLQPAAPPAASLLAPRDALDPIIESVCVPVEEAVTIRGGFDCVIGNPPYVFGRDWQALGIPLEMKRKLRSTYRWTSYQMDMFSLFMERAATLASPGGRVGQIVPNVWLTNSYSASTRRGLLGMATELTIAVAPSDVFAGIVVDTVVYSTTQGAGPPESIGLVALRPDSEVPLGRLPGADYSSGDRPIPTTSGAAGAPVHHRLLGLGMLGSVAEVTRGVHSYRTGGYGQSAFGAGTQTARDVAERPYHSGCPRPGYRPFVRGRDLVRLGPVSHSAYVRYGPWLAEPRDAAFFEGTRIYSRKILGDRLVATLIADDSVADQQVYITRVTAAGLCAQYVVALLASRLLAYFIRTYYGEEGDQFPQIKVGQLRSLPIPTLDLSSRSDVAKHDKMVTLVETMLDLHKRVADARTPADRNLVQRRIDATDRQIDHLVYELYGLTEDEIAIVEGAVG